MMQEAIERLAMWRDTMVTIRTGLKDVVNGYGFHVVYFVELTKIQEVCRKCEKQAIHKRCSWVRRETKTSTQFIDYHEMVAYLCAQVDKEAIK